MLDLLQLLSGSNTANTGTGITVSDGTDAVVTEASSADNDVTVADTPTTVTFPLISTATARNATSPKAATFSGTNESAGGNVSVSIARKYCC